MRNPNSRWQVYRPKTRARSLGHKMAIVAVGVIAFIEVAAVFLS